MSNVVKMFKLCCARLNGNTVHSIELINSHLNAFVYEFTTTTFIMVIVSDPDVKPAATLMNIDLARPHFERLLRPSF
jgi:Ras-related GTP-binding protein A/B